MICDDPDNTDIETGWRKWLGKRDRAGLRRQRRTRETPQQPRAIVDGQQLLAFCSNDYLGLANHPEVIEALRRGATNWGVGSGASHLINGHSRAHQALEQELASFLGRERALLFSTGYTANMGTIAAILERPDRIFEDRLNHASLLDAALLSGARLQRYLHNDIDSLRLKMQRPIEHTTLVATDGVFSMDGDLAPLPGIVSLCADHDATLLVDDAHGIGVIGATGGGICEHFGLDQQQVPILIGTLGKALGTMGAFVAGSETLIEMLIQRARPYIYTTALPPALAEATRAALRVCAQEHWRREHLRSLVVLWQQGLNELGLPTNAALTPIQPLIIGDPDRAVALSRRLQEAGILVPAIRPPTVANGASRLRFTFSAAHSEADVEQLLDAVARVYEKFGQPA